MFVLFEHAAGYALFRVKEFEDVGSFLPQVEQSVTDLSRFNGVVKLVAFAPFKSAAHALDNINSISEGMIYSTWLFEVDIIHFFLQVSCLRTFTSFWKPICPSSGRRAKERIMFWVLANRSSGQPLPRASASLVSTLAQSLKLSEESGFTLPVSLKVYQSLF